MLVTVLYSLRLFVLGGEHNYCHGDVSVGAHLHNQTIVYRVGMGQISREWHKKGFLTRREMSQKTHKSHYTTTKFQVLILLPFKKFS